MTDCNSSSRGRSSGAGRKPQRTAPGSSPVSHRTFRERVGDARWGHFLEGFPVITRPAGWPLVHEGEEGNRVFALIGGVVGVEQSGVDRRELEQLLVFRGGGDLIGDMAVIERISRTATVRARTECEVAIIPGVRFMSPEFQREWGAEVSAYISGRVREVQTLSRSGNDSARVAHVLLPLLRDAERAGRTSGGFHLRVSQQEVANCLGIGRDTLRRLTSLPPFGGWPKGRGGGLVITDPAALRTVAAGLGGWHPQVG
ncbi:Crp/Fnr family transcriptional regulator [Kitasatospora sp. NPDC089509]|uniref:Crp/Fnr family transcriptional regulator n=1 Tax=Kitasatospora sp. NPDC089509 TaxID=3364079 RepID=UPI0038068AD1